MKKCNECTFNCGGKCLVVTGISLKMSDGKQKDYIEYANTPENPCKDFKPYVTRMRDANK